MRMPESVSSLSLTAVDAVLVTHQASLRYVTGGFSGSGMALLTADKRFLLTDASQAAWAEQQASDFEVVALGASESLRRKAAALVRSLHLQTLRYEERTISLRRYAAMADTIGGETALLPLGHALDKLRMVKTPEELQCIRAACRVTSRAMQRTVETLHTGETERQIAQRLNIMLLEEGAEELAFPTQVLSGERGAMIHAPESDRPLAPDELVTLDGGASVGGYCADMTRTVCKAADGTLCRSRAEEALQELYAQLVQRLRPGESCGELAQWVNEDLLSRGYAALPHALGHGVGLEVHELPRIVPGSRECLQPGMVIALEPAVYEGDTAFRREDTFLITDSGCEPLTGVSFD